MTTVDFNQHYVPLLQQYTLRLSELFDDTGENSQSRSSIWNKIQIIISSLSPHLLNIIVTNHADLVELILNNLSIDTFERSVTEWSHTCACLQSILKGTESTIWSFSTFKLSEVADDMLEVLSVLFRPTEKKSTTSESFLQAPVIVAFEVMTSLVETTDELSHGRIKMLILFIEEILMKNAPSPQSFSNKGNGAVGAIASFSRSITNKERIALTNIVSSNQYTGHQDIARNMDIISISSYFYCHLCDLVTSALTRDNSPDTFAIQIVLLDNTKWVGCLSEDCFKMMDKKLQLETFPAVSRQHQSLGNMISSMNSKINLAKNDGKFSSLMTKRLKMLLSYIPYCLVSYNAHLKSTSLHFFQSLVEYLSDRCCHSRSWANPMQVLDPLVENESFLSIIRKGTSYVLTSSSSSPFEAIVKACIELTEFLSNEIKSFSDADPVQMEPMQRSFTTGAVRSESCRSELSPLSRASSVDSHTRKKHSQARVSEDILNKLFVTAIAGVFSFYDRIRVILHTSFLHIGKIMTENEKRNLSPSDSVIAWQELWCMTLPSWEEKLRLLKLKKSLFKNSIVPEVSSLPAAPHLMSAPVVVDMSDDKSSDPLRDYMKVIAPATAPATHENSEGKSQIKSSTNETTKVGEMSKSRNKVGLIKKKSFLKPFDDTKSVVGKKDNISLSHVPSSDPLKTSRATVVKIDMKQKPANEKMVSSSKKHIIKGGATALKEQLKAREISSLLESKCGGIEDYGDDFAYEKSDARDIDRTVQYQPHKGTQPFYTKHQMNVTENYNYSSYRSTESNRFDDFRKSKKRGSESLENTAIPPPKFQHVSDSLDTFGEYNVGADLDSGYEDSSTSNDKKEGSKNNLKSAVATTDITTLLGKYSSSDGRKGEKSTNSNLVSASISSIPMLMSQKSADDANLTMMQKMSNVNIDDFYYRLLKLPLHNELPSRDDLEICPVRFLNEEKYINLFQPLLEAELDAMLSEAIATNCKNSRISDMNIYGPKSSTATSSILPKVYLRCALIQPRAVSSAVHLNSNSAGLEFITGLTSNKVDSTKIDNKAGASSGYFAESHSDSSNNLEEVRVAVVASPFRGSGTTHSPPPKLIRDDLVVLFDSNVFNAVLDIHSLSMKDLLMYPHCLAVAVSQHNKDGAPAANNDGGEDYGQQTLVVLKDAAPPSTSTWLCVPFVSLSTHTREWKALHSIRSHSLLPLVPYLLKAAPVISASRLQNMYRDLEKGINGIVQTKALDVNTDLGRQQNVLISERVSHVLEQLEMLGTTNIDFSVLSVTKMPDKLKALSSRKGLEHHARVISLLKDIRAKWKTAVKVSNKSSTIRGLKGGNVITAYSMGELERLQTSPAEVPSPLWKVLARSHNEVQLFAIKYVVSSMKIDINEGDNDTRICLIQGPPGTGKTRTIIAMVSTLVHLGVTCQSSGVEKEAGGNSSSEKRSPKVKTNRILVCAPSNAAVDEVLLRLLKQGIVNQNGKIRRPKLVRLGKPLENCPKEISDMTLENQVEKLLERDPAWKKLQKALESTTSLKRQLAQNQPNVGNSLGSGSIGEEQRRKLRSELRLAHGSKIAAELQVSIRRIELRRMLLESCDVLAGTLSASGQYTVLDHVKQYDIRFETVLIDEAAQATEPATLIPLRYGCKTLVLVGDPRQLPAYVASHSAERAGLGKSLFERLEQAGHAVVMLSVQYRMHPRISDFPSKQFYGGKLRDAHRIQVECGGAAVAVGESNNSSQTKSRVLSPLCKEKSPFHFSPVTLFDIQGKEETSSKSFRNRTEVEFVFSLLETLSRVPCMQVYKIGILSPYKGQVNYMRGLLKADNKNSACATALTGLNIEVNTIDGFQGREKDFIILSTVRSNSHGVGFLSDIRRLNVAITRAKRCLLIVGCANTLKQDAVWNAYITMLRESSALVPGPKSGRFQDFVGYKQIMIMVEGLIDENSGSVKTSAKAIDAKPVMQRTINMLQLRNSADQSEVAQVPADKPQACNDFPISTLHKNDTTKNYLEEGEVEEDDSERLKQDFSNLIRKKPRI